MKQTNIHKTTPSKRHNNKTLHTKLYNYNKTTAHRRNNNTCNFEPYVKLRPVLYMILDGL